MKRTLNTAMPDAETKEKMINLMAGFRTPQCAFNAAFKSESAESGTGEATVGGPQRQPNPAPPPVARVTRRTSMMNQHEHLRRMRDEDGSLSSSSGRAGVAVRQIAGIAVRRIASSRGSSASSAVISPMVLAPLHFDEDDEEEDNGGDEDEMSEDGNTPLSIGEDDEEGTPAPEEMSVDGSVERARGAVSMQHNQQIQQHIQQVHSF
uniref:Uncharacterized protein n=1 Tax=Globodera pallida TaxID=36090 RepID=A0A183CEZ7_GLOPA